MTSKATCVAWANRALVRAAAAFAAFAAYRSLHSSSTTIKLEGHSRFDFGRGRRTLQLERAIAVAALVLKTSEAQSAFAGRAAA